MPPLRNRFLRVFRLRARFLRRRFSLRPPALDLDADPAGAELQLLDPDRHAHDARVLKHMRRHLLGKRLAELDMAARDDGADAVHDDVVGEDVAHVLRVLGDAQHISGNVEAHLLRMAVLETVGADLHGQHEIPDEDLVRPERRDRLLPANSRVPPAADSRRSPSGPAWRSSGISERICSTASALIEAVRCELSQSAPRKPRKSGANGKSRGNVRRFQRSAQPDFQAERPGAVDEYRDAFRRQMVEQPPLGFVGRVDHDAMEAVCREIVQQAEIRLLVGEKHGDQLRRAPQAGQGLPRRRRRLRTGRSLILT